MRRGNFRGQCKQLLYGLKHFRTDIGKCKLEPRAMGLAIIGQGMLVRSGDDGNPYTFLPHPGTRTGLPRAATSPQGPAWSFIHPNYLTLFMALSLKPIKSLLGSIAQLVGSSPSGVSRTQEATVTKNY